LLILKIKGDGVIPARAAKELHRSRTWASEWLERYDNDGIDGLKDKPKTGRPPKLSEEIALRIRKTLFESKQGWTTKQVEDMIMKEGEVKYHYTHIYRLLHKWVSNLKYQEKYISMRLQKKRKKPLKKSTENTKQSL